MISKTQLDTILSRQKWNDRIFKVVAAIGVLIALITLGALLIDALIDGVPRLSWEFLTSFPSRKPARSWNLLGFGPEVCT